MSSSPGFVQYIAGQIKKAGEIRYRMMFGEYVVYCNDKLVALICDNKLYIKPTEAGRAYIGAVTEAPPYPGAKMSFLIEEQIENPEWMSKLIEVTEKELPPPKPKKKKENKK
jgi:TfoX/Sxy family transcriptional regulator of competence genes